MSSSKNTADVRIGRKLERMRVQLAEITEIFSTYNTVDFNRIYKMWDDIMQKITAEIERKASLAEKDDLMQEAEDLKAEAHNLSLRITLRNLKATYKSLADEEDEAVADEGDEELAAMDVRKQELQELIDELRLSDETANPTREEQQETEDLQDDADIRAMQRANVELERRLDELEDD